MSEQILSWLYHWWPGLLILIVLLSAGSILFQPWNIDELVSHPHPVNSYDEAVQRIQSIQAGETNLNPLCQTRFLTHGATAQRAILFVHGYTNCPQQFAELGKRFYNLGYNVLIATVPYHGLADRLTDEQGRLTAEDLAAYADRIVDIGCGLGKHLTLAGISLGGVVVSWAAQDRHEVDLAVLISPGFSYHAIPNGLTVPVANLFMLLPVSYEWWNPALKEKSGPVYTYPRFSKHVLGEIMRLGLAVRSAAQRAAPAAHSILIVTNANDRSVNNETTAQMIRLWQANGARLATYEFPITDKLGHDLIDLNNQDRDIEFVYLRLIDLIDNYPA